MTKQSKKNKSNLILDLFNGVVSHIEIKKKRISDNTRINKEMRANVVNRLRYENLHLSEGMTFTSANGFAQLEPYNGPIPPLEKIYPYTMKSAAKESEIGLHFFVYDRYFAKSLWNRLEQITKGLARFDILFTPDYSCFVDAPTVFVNKTSIYKTRFIGAYWQKCGFNVIPTATYGDVDSFSWCFEGLPENSIIAIGNETVRLNDPFSVRLWQLAVLELEKQKKPTLIIIYGKRIEVPGLSTPTMYFPGYVQTHFRNGN